VEKQGSRHGTSGKNHKSYTANCGVQAKKMAEKHLAHKFHPQIDGK
jgi:hypothetical protein